MQFRCASSDLTNGIQTATKALSARSPQPILEGVLMETCPNGLRMTCSDGQITIVTTIPATIEEDGRVVMPGKLFSEVVRKMPASEITAKMGDNLSMTLRSLGSRTTIAGMNADNFPQLPSINGARKVTLPQALLKDMIGKTSFAIASEEDRPVLTGCLFEMEAGEVRMVALDGFRLAMKLNRVSDVDTSISCIIPGKSLSEVGKLLSDEDDKQVEMIIGDTQALVKMESTNIYMRLIDGEYIKYRQILPASWKSRVCVSNEELSRCVDRASLMAREGKNNLIKMDIAENHMIITSNSEIGDVHEEMDIETEGDSLLIAFNVKYMIDVMRAIDDDEVYMKFNSSVSPCVVSPVEGDDYLYLILPVRINA